MGTEVETRELTFIAGGAIGANLRVKLTAGKLAICDATDVGIGVTRNAVFADGDRCAVAVWNMQGSVKIKAGGGFAHGDLIYGAAAGTVDNVETANIVGYATEAASGSGSIAGVLPLLGLFGGTLARTSIVQEDAVPYPIPLEAWYLFDSTIHAPLGATALSADDMIYTYGAAGTAEPILKGTDPGGTNATQYARTRVTVPAEYVAGQPVSLQIVGLTGTTVADGSSTVDFNVYRAAGPTVDICATSAQSINSLTPVTKTFTLTPTNVVPGDVLDILMTYYGIDTANVGTMVPTVSSTVLLYSIKG
jgi:hypothetical protein